MKKKNKIDFHRHHEVSDQSKIRKENFPDRFACFSIQDIFYDFLAGGVYPDMLVQPRIREKFKLIPAAILGADEAIICEGDYRRQAAQKIHCISRGYRAAKKQSKALISDSA